MQLVMRFEMSSLVWCMHNESTVSAEFPES